MHNNIEQYIYIYIYKRQNFKITLKSECMVLKRFKIMKSNQNHYKVDPFFRLLVFRELSVTIDCVQDEVNI